MELNNIPDKVYHGTTSNFFESLLGADGKPLIERSKIYLDNGKGFYTTGLINQVKSHSLYREDTLNSRIQNKIDRGTTDIQFVEALIIEYDVDKEALNRFCKNPLVLLEKDEKWARFILNNRVRETELVEGNLHNRHHTYDLVYSAMADGKMNSIMKSYDVLEGNRSEKFKSAFEEMAKEFSFGESEQISFHDDVLLQKVLSVNNVYQGNDINKLR